MRSWDHVVGIVIGLFGAELVIMLLFSMLLGCSSLSDMHNRLVITDIDPADYATTNYSYITDMWYQTNYNSILYLYCAAPVIGTNVFVQISNYIISNTWQYITNYYYTEITNESVQLSNWSSTNLFMVVPLVFWYRITN